MVFKIVILFALVAYTPGLAQTSAAVVSGDSATASASSYVSSSCGNGKVHDCTYNRCTPTCSLRFPENCPQNSNPCKCPPGTIVSEQGGKCVQEEFCQKYSNCKGDYNATFTDCSISSPSTCARPNAEHRNIQCAAPGCECNPGYLLSSKNGKCIKPEDCPGGNVCGRNETFMSCLVECPDLYCPVDENRVACGVGRFCLSSCGCKSGYLRRSVKDRTCILSSECPPGKCSRPNEEWNRCVPLCFSDTCTYRKTLRADCPFSPLECYPRCVCKENFYRDVNNVCVPVKECPLTE